MSTMSNCPYDFINDFDNWFKYQTYIHSDNLTPEQARTNVQMYKNGWTLAKGMKYGGWVYTKEKKSIVMYEAIINDNR